MLKEKDYLKEFDKIVSRIKIDSEKKTKRSSNLFVQFAVIAASMYLSNAAAIYVWRLCTGC